MQYRYETHLHTSESSACAVSKGSEYIKPYIEAGYAGLFVTDHFFGGNTAVPRNGVWTERIEQFCRGYEHAAAEAAKYPGFKVFFGLEQTFDGDDYLIYGPDKQWLLAHPETETMTSEDLFNCANDLGWLIVQAHPFRQRHYIQATHIRFRHIHAIETYNASNYPEENSLAALFAKTYGFPATCGTDIHDAANVSDGSLLLKAMTFSSPLRSVGDYIRRVKNRKLPHSGILRQ